MTRRGGSTASWRAIATCDYRICPTSGTSPIGSASAERPARTSQWPKTKTIGPCHRESRLCISSQSIPDARTGGRRREGSRVGTNLDFISTSSDKLLLLLLTEPIAKQPTQADLAHCIGVKPRRVRQLLAKLSQTTRITVRNRGREPEA